MQWHASFFAVLALSLSALVNAQTDQDKAALVELVAQLKQENIDFKAALSQQDKIAAELKKTHDNATALREQLAQAHQQLETRQQLLNASENRADAAQNELAAQHEQSAAQQQHILTLQTTLAQRDTALTVIRTELDTERAATVSQQAAARRYRGMLSSARTNSRALADELDSLREQNQQTMAKHQAAARRYQGMLNSARTNSRALAGELDSLREQNQQAMTKHQAAARRYRGMLNSARTNSRALASELEKSKQTRYTVKLGDSLSRIAQSYYGDPQQWQRIFDANNAALNSPESLEPGMTLLIPQ